MRSFSKSFVSMLAVVASSFLLSGCNAYKPDHPQAFQSFRDRRLPAQNQLAENGTLSGQKPSNPQANYAGESVSEVGQGQQSVAQNSGASVSMDAANNSQNLNPNDKKNKSFFERFVGGFENLTGAKEEEPAQKLASNNSKRYPTENGILVAYNSDNTFSQGGAKGSSYFDIAEEIPSITSEEKLSLINEAKAQEVRMPEVTQLPEEPVQQGATSVPTPQPPVPPVIDKNAINTIQSMGDAKVDMAKQVVGQQSVDAANPSAVKIPEVPSNEQMKQEIPKQKEPQLSSVPQVDKKVHQQEKKVDKVAPVKQQKVDVKLKQKKKVEQKEEVEPVMNLPEDIKTQDNSLIVEQDGKRVVTGYLSR